MSDRFVRDGDYRKGDHIRLDAVVAEPPVPGSGGSMRLRCNGREFEMGRSLVAELIDRKKMPGQRAYEQWRSQHPGRYRDWEQLADDERRNWSLIAAAARED